MTWVRTLPEMAEGKLSDSSYSSRREGINTPVTAVSVVAGARVVAPVLDYGSWVRSLAHEDVFKLFADYGKGGGAFEVAFQQRFDAPPAEELNTGHRLTIIASAVDVATERIVEYLVEEYSVPVNVVVFRYFEGEGHRYLARTWLIDQARAPEPTGGSISKAKEPWNGRVTISVVLCSPDTRPRGRLAHSLPYGIAHERPSTTDDPRACRCPPPSPRCPGAGGTRRPTAKVGFEASGDWACMPQRAWRRGLA
jgi:hypothetical protein